MNSVTEGVDRAPLPLADASNQITVSSSAHKRTAVGQLKVKTMKRICVAYFSGATGHTMGMFVIGDGLLVGADFSGIRFDGSVSPAKDGSLEGLVRFIIPAGAQLITGLSASDSPQEVTAKIALPFEFDDGKHVVRIDTPAGPVNARFERLREIS